MHLAGSRQRGNAFKWFLPMVHAQIESAIVDRQQPFATQV